jgi:hypothetical protein
MDVLDRFASELGLRDGLDIQSVWKGPARYYEDDPCVVRIECIDKKDEAQAIQSFMQHKYHQFAADHGRAPRIHWVHGRPFGAVSVMATKTDRVEALKQQKYVFSRCIPDLIQWLHDHSLCHADLSLATIGLTRDATSVTAVVLSCRRALQVSFPLLDIGFFLCNVIKQVPLDLLHLFCKRVKRFMDDSPVGQCIRLLASPNWQRNAHTVTKRIKQVRTWTIKEYNKLFLIEPHMHMHSHLQMPRAFKSQTWASVLRSPFKWKPSRGQRQQRARNVRIEFFNGVQGGSIRGHAAPLEPALVNFK